MAVALIAPLLALAGCMGDNQEAVSAETQAGLARALAGRTAGNPTSCLPPGPLLSTTKSYGKVLLYTLANGDLYANDTAGGCENRGDDIFVEVEHEGRACSGDIIHLVDRTSHIPTGSCALGQFTPYPKVRR
ncbi:hypothetical protein [Sphingomonas bacterium]|uniref:hypothetical protein n=1 Tax=Sphingomonas bacterium TaxID=1895847 RepID=UPI001575B0E8|nr:hypothetical protein [Sphingomonas bacterium]